VREVPSRLDHSSGVSPECEDRLSGCNFSAVWIQRHWIQRFLCRGKESSVRSVYICLVISDSGIRKGREVSGLETTLVS